MLPGLFVVFFSTFTQILLQEVWLLNEETAKQLTTFFLPNRENKCTVDISQTSFNRWQNHAPLV